MQNKPSSSNKLEGLFAFLFALRNHNNIYLSNTWAYFFVYNI